MDTRIILCLLSCVLLSRIASSAACRFGSDRSCAFPCKCADEWEICDRDTGACPQSGCRQTQPSGYGWGGEGCLTGNVAYKKPANQSGTWEGHTADRAVDGNTNPILSEGSCAHPDSSQSGYTPHKGPAWWMVDLRMLHVIQNVTIYNRGDYPDGNYRSGKLEIRVGNASNVDQDYIVCRYLYNEIEVGGNQTIECPTYIVGRYVSIVKAKDSREQNAMNFCEVIVMGYPYTDCNQCESPSTCNDMQGCDQCPAGKQRPSCTQDCAYGTYGYNCLSDCHCRKQMQCDFQTGMCDDGCDDWYVGDECQKYIGKPSMLDKDVTVFVINSSSVDISWDAASNIEDGRYYYYMIEYFPYGGDSIVYDKKIPHNGKTNVIIGQLYASTEYYFNVIPYRNMSNSVGAVITDRGDPSPNVIINTEPAPNTPSPTTTSTTTSTPQPTSASPTTTPVPTTPPLTTTTKRSVSSQQTPSTTKMPGPLVTGTTLTTGLLNDAATEPLMGANSNNDTPTGTIIGAVIGGIVLVVLVVLLALFLLRYKRRGEVPLKKLSLKDIEVQHNQEDAAKHLGMANPAFQHDSAPPSPLHVDQVDMPAGNAYANVTPEALPPIPVGELAAYVEKNKADAAGFKKEYAKIPQGELFRCERGELEENIKKNRFLNIKAYDHTRVVLDKEDDDEYSDYVNANYLTGYKEKEKAYVATQGPRPVTVNDIWRLIWHINTNRIVMVTNLMENGKRKCERYWPEHQGESVDYGHITVTTVSVEEYADYTVSIFNVSKASTGHRQVMHFHFTSWQDKRIPDYAFPLLSFQRRVRSYNSGARGPLLVHCSAGVGRTGTYLALDYLLQQAEAEKQVDVFGYVNLMRTQRMNMIQTLEQYIFVYDALVESIRVGDTTVSTAKLPPTYKQWSSKKPGAAMSKLEEQFTILTEFHPHNRDMGKSSALRSENVDKNRFPEIYASDMCRPYLSTRVEDGTDYINATFVGSYHSRDALLATQAPLPNTVADIWRLVNDHSANCIVMLNEEKDMDETCGVYWPSEEESSITFDLMTITQTECNTEHPNILVRDMTLVHNSDPEIPVRQFVLHDVWPADCELPDPGVMCDLVDQVEKWQQTYGKGKHKVIIHCMNGVDRTGLLCACLNIIEKLRVEQEVDIFTSVKHIKKSWTDFISTEAQYKFLYEMVQTYILRYDTYANFK